MKKPVPVLIPFLALVSAIFIGILIYVYVETKKANPQMLDEQGRRVGFNQPTIHPRPAGLKPRAG